MDIKGILLKDMGQVNSILKFNTDKPFSNKELRLDLIEDSLKREDKVYFSNDFSLDLLDRRRQGWDLGRGLEMLNTLLNYYKFPNIIDLKEFNKNLFNKSTIKEISENMPPVIVSLLPDGTFHLEDGNHRIAILEIFLGLKEIRAFIIK